MIAGLTAWALMHSTSVRERLDGASRTARQRIDEMRKAGASLDRPYDVASALEEAGVTANEYLDGLDATTDMMAAAEDGTTAHEEAASARLTSDRRVSPGGARDARASRAGRCRTGGRP